MFISSSSIINVNFFFQGVNKEIDSELLEYSVHAGAQTTLQAGSYNPWL